MSSEYIPMVALSTTRNKPQISIFIVWPKESKLTTVDWETTITGPAWNLIKVRNRVRVYFSASLWWPQKQMATLMKT